MKNFFREAFSSLKVRNYRLYFIGQAVSLCGSWMQTIAQDWLVLKLTNSGTQLGLVTAAQFLPVLILGVWGGVITDRWPKRRLLFITQTGFGLLALILGILVVANAVQLWMVYVLAAGFGILTSLDHPSRQAFVYEMVGKDLISNALTLNIVEFNTARILGPTIAAALIAWVGLASCFFINALSFIAVLTILALMRKAELVPSKIQRGESAFLQLKQGFKYVKSKPLLLGTLIVMAIVGTLCYEFSVSLPLLAKFTFNGGAGTYAALTSAMGVGSIIGGLFIAGEKKATRKMFLFSTLMLGVAVSLTAFMPSLPLAIVTLGVAGFFSVSFVSQGNTILQLSSSSEMRGRVISFWTVANFGSTPIGGPIIGFLGEHLGPRWGLGVGGVAAIFAAALGNYKLKQADKT